VRVKYEVPASVDPSRVLAAVRDAVAGDDWVVGKKSVKVYINQATLASYVISIDALCAGNLEEPPRSAMYVRTMKVVAGLTPAAAPANAAGPTAGVPQSAPPTAPPAALPGTNPITRL
jgi:hypothetical protein